MKIQTNPKIISEVNTDGNTDGSMWIPFKEYLELVKERKRMEKNDPLLKHFIGNHG